MQSLKDINKELERAGLEQLTELPSEQTGKTEQPKGKWTAKRLGIAGLVAATAVGLYVGFPRPQPTTESTTQYAAVQPIVTADSKETIRKVMGEIEVVYTHDKSIESVTVFNKSYLEASVSAANGKVYRLLMMPSGDMPLVYIDIRHGVYVPRQIMNGEAAFLLEAGGDLVTEMKEELR